MAEPYSIITMSDLCVVIIINWDLQYDNRIVFVPPEEPPVASLPIYYLGY